MYKVQEKTKAKSALICCATADSLIGSFKQNVGLFYLYWYSLKSYKTDIFASLLLLAIISHQRHQQPLLYF